MNLSSRILSMQSSPIRRLVPYAQKAKKNGKKVYHLNIGQPDIKTPKSFLQSIRDFDQEVLEYSTSQGSEELRNAMINYYKNYNINFELDDIFVTNGGSEALLFALIAVCDPDEEVLIPEPFYTNYSGFSAAINVNVKPITTSGDNGFRLPTKEDIEKTISTKTKAILISNPGNPTGAVYTKDEIMMLASLAKEYNLFIIADEVYREFVYDGLEYISFGSIKEIEDRVIIVDSVSKRYSACGARIGSIASKNKDLMRNILKLCQGRLCVPTLEQIGATKLYETDKSYFEEVNLEYKNRRDALYSRLIKIDGVSCKKPTGAFYIIAKLPVDDAEVFVKWMLEEFDLDGETVMMAPAEGFYKTKGLGKDEARLAYILNEKDLIRSVEILEAGLKAYNNR
ncbi:pyridoxal phosphate-dependent aminotransferase [Peptostreptococcaceae bacterium AGR-M142]